MGVGPDKLRPMAWLRSFVLHPSPLPVGSPAPDLSLTADDGTWVRSDDHVGRRALVLVFFRTAGRRDTSRLLRAMDARRPAIEAAGALVYGINQDRPDRLRRHREAGVDMTLLYDLLAATSRTFRQAGRRPYVRDGVVVVGPDGTIALHSREADPGDAVMTCLEALGRADDRKPRRALDIDWTNAQELIDAGTPVLDVRTRGEHAALHVPGAIHIPLDELPARHAELTAHRRLVCVCQTGGRSSAAAGFLASVGHDEVYNVLGGMSAWPGAPGG